eukprot:3866288-Ditylum_brightwellii.AAC.1
MESLSSDPAPSKDFSTKDRGDMSSSLVSATSKDESNDKGSSNNDGTGVIIDSATIDIEERDIKKSEEDVEKGI